MSKTSLRFDREEFEAKVKKILLSLEIPANSINNYTLAFVHRSVLNEERSGFLESNERLEFLWDAVLELVITERLYQDFPKKLEWELTDIRSALVRGRNLAQIAAWLGFSDAILLSRWEFLAGWQNNPYILANTFEALLGWIYIDLGLEFVREFLMKHVYSTLPLILEHGLYVDPKSYLQEYTQWIWGFPPQYDVIDEIGQDHNKVYTVRVSLDNVEFALGKWSSKKKAEQDAAENAITEKNNWSEKITLPKKEIK